MSLGKLPGIKGLVSGPQGKRRFKNDLSAEMISPPLADFRHTMHVGRGGEVFGDTSFLSNHGGSGAPGSPDSTTGSSKTTRFLSRTLRHIRKSPAPCPRGSSHDLSPPPPPVSPIIKNAISLPQLNLDTPNGCLQRVLFPSSLSSPGDSLYSYGLQSGFVTLPRHSRLERQLQDGEYRRGSLPDNGDFPLQRSDSFTSFTVDLGPSLMSEMLDLIDNPGCLQMADHSWAEEDEEGEEAESRAVLELAAESPVLSSTSASTESSTLRAHSTHRGRSSSPERTEQEGGGPPRVPDASMASPVQVEPTMEAERFQRAADVLARHYGGGSSAKGRSQSQQRSRSDLQASSSPSTHGHKELFAFQDEEEEIKV